MAKNRKVETEAEDAGIEQDVETTKGPALSTFMFPVEGVTVEATDAADAAAKLKATLSHQED